MEYGDLRPAVDAFRQGRNVMSALRDLLMESGNIDRIVEIAYDLQAGSYARYVEQNRSYWRAYSDEITAILAPLVPQGSRVLDVGTGEMTTLAGVAPVAFAVAAEIYAFDISFSRIRAGWDFVGREIDSDMRNRLRPFVGNLFRLPFVDATMDVVWTSHALEPNGGREREALQEIFRVARNHVVLFEPSYERNSQEGRRRMDGLGYVRDLPGAIESVGGLLFDIIPLVTVSNPLNPTHAYVCKVRTSKPATLDISPWGCPSTRLPMERKGDCFFSAASRLAYPIVDGVPILRVEQAILASALDPAN